MNLLAFAIPDDLERVPEWLEGHLMGLDLHQVVTELQVLGGTSENPAVALTDVLGDQLQEVLQLGLRSLSRPQLRQLMSQPSLLIELQQQVLENGGPYWDTVPSSDDIAQNTEKTWANLKTEITSVIPMTEVAQRATTRKFWLWSSAGWVAATAAAIGLFFVRADRVRQLENRLAQQSAEINSLRNDLLAQQRVLPADLPEAEEKLVHAPVDPPDLPADDPPDLPKIL